MSKTLPNMLENTIGKIREMVDVNSVVGDPITTPDGVTIIPISKVSIGFGGGGSDFVSKNVNKHENPFGGGAGAGIQVTPVAFLIVKDGSVRMLPVAEPASTTADRMVEMAPDLLAKLEDTFDYVIVDAPPLGQVIDCAVIAPHLDGVFLLVDVNHNSYKLTRRIKTQLDKSGGKVLGVVLNNVNFNGKRSYYRKRYGYGYGYSYDYGYGDDD